MSAITGACARLMGELLHALGSIRLPSSPNHVSMLTAPTEAAACEPPAEEADQSRHDLMIQALTAVFGMENNGRINKEKARQVVEKLGLVEQEEATNFDLPGGGGICDVLEEEVAVEEVLGGFMEEDEEEENDGSNRNELLRQAFKIFDEDGNGFIDALELKRVLQCLGLDNGWDMSQIQNMLKVVDLNLDGKVDFFEFQLMMMG